MIKKMTLEEFYQIKSQLSKIVKFIENNESYDEEKLVSEYMSIQNTLLNYDLSDIPFEAWKGFEILSDDNNIADFSKTKANIDFNIVNYYGNGNFKGCNIRNLSEIERWINPSSFDEDTIKTNSLLFLDDSFSDYFKDKYYSCSLTIEDLATLSKEQLAKILEKDYKKHMDYNGYNAKLLDTLGLSRVIELYNYSQEEYEAINKLTYYIFSNFYGKSNALDNFLQQTENMQVDSIKDFWFTIAKEQIVCSNSTILKENLPELFLKENKDIFLLDTFVPDDVKERYFNRRLTLNDLLTYKDVFENISVDYFMDDSVQISKYIRDNYGMNKFQELLKKHPLLFEHMQGRFSLLEKYLKKGNDLERDFTIAIKEYFLNYEISNDFKNISEEGIMYNVPEWLKSMNFRFIESIQTSSELLQYEERDFILDYSQRKVLNALNIENIKRFEQETGFFSHRSNAYSSDLEMFTMFTHYFKSNDFDSLRREGIDFKNGKLSYDEFVIMFANCLNNMRKNFVFTDFPNYDWIQGKFREEHPEIFMDINVPIELKEAFYKGRITPSLLFDHKEYIPYLLDKNLKNTICLDMSLSTIGLIDEEGNIFHNYSNFISEYTLRYGNEKLLNLISKYGELLSEITVSSFNGEIDNEELIEASLRKALYDKIINGGKDYSYLTNVKDFVSEYNDLFLSEDAPKELKEAFYKGRITPILLFLHKEYIPYLLDKNLKNKIKLDLKLEIPIIDNNGKIEAYNYLNFNNEYLSRYGNEKLLSLISKYGELLSGITISNCNGEIDNIETIELSLRNALYNKILTGRHDYSYLVSVQEFVQEHEDMFLSEDAPKELKDAFYRGRMTSKLLLSHKEYIPYLINKNLKNKLRIEATLVTNIFDEYGISKTSYSNFIDEYLIRYGNENLLKLILKYGELLSNITILNYNGEINNQELIETSLRKKIFDKIKTGNYDYSHLSYVQEFVQEHEDMFLSEDAPEELKKYFYNYQNNYPMSFKILEENKEWMPYLKDKSLLISLLRNSYLKNDVSKFFEIFGEEKAIKLGITKGITADEMIKSSQVELMKAWYDKSGGKFIPDFVVMQNFSLDEADKFFASGTNWNNLMRIKLFSETQESRDAILKLAYSFGVFDNDQRGFKKLQDLLTGLPRKIDADKIYIFDRIEEEMNTAINGSGINSNIYTNLIESLKKEKVNIDYSKPIFSQLYRINEDKSFTLTINSQSCPISSQYIKQILGNFRELQLLTPERAHQLFGGFELKYDSDFREFMLANMDKILSESESARLLSIIQRRFSEIKSMNSNRVLTWELAVSYVQTNKYSHVEVGNEKVAEISSIAGYSEEDFNILQQIYNYGKQRTFSSIPRIEKTKDKYTYEILRLDDPLAMAIGTLTDCCQELHNCAEVCMEHSMVDKNGRVFVIRDEHKNIVAQSWVWRNKNVVCFDNIEIPNKAFTRAIREDDKLDRRSFTDEIYAIYKDAARELIEEDEKVYRMLFESGKITEEQYLGLRLAKVTVGLGYNDIAESLKQNSKIDAGRVSRPLPFDEPVKLARGLYTSDSVTQYILEEKEDRRIIDTETLAVHNDDYVEYTDSNFGEKELRMLQRLEMVTKENQMNLRTNYIDCNANIVTEILENYGLETGRIVMNPNFAIIYSISGDNLQIVDLLFNTKIDNDRQQIDIEKEVILQMRLALEQISGNKEIDVSYLNERQIGIYNKVISLTEEMDIERGIRHGK